MAAAYLFHIVNNHPFVDGNKRTGFVATLIFLSLNGIEIDANNKEVENMVLQVASGQMNKEQISEWLKQHS